MTALGAIIFAAMDILTATQKKDREVAINTFGNAIVSHGTDAYGSWVKFGNGFKVAWGVNSDATTTGVANRYGSTAGTMYYKTGSNTFPGGGFSSAPVVIVNAINNAVGAVAHPSNIGTTSFTVIVESYANSNTITFNWIAIGDAV